MKLIIYEEVLLSLLWVDQIGTTEEMRHVNKLIVIQLIIIYTNSNIFLHSLVFSPKDSGYSPELCRALRTFELPCCQADEQALCQQFDQPDHNRKWREGIIKSSFNYLLLDPRSADIYLWFYLFIFTVFSVSFYFCIACK